MEAFPLNLILAVATASATIFLGFLPTKTTSSKFFARQATLAVILWVIVAFLSPHKIFHYPLFFAFFLFLAWRQFRKDDALTGKMWLSIASGLGISVGVMLILTVTPQAYPPGLPPLNEALLLASIYLGGGIIGLAYVCLELSRNFNAGITQNILHRYTGLLFALTIVRVIVLFLNLWHPATKGTVEIGHEFNLHLGDRFQTILFSIAILSLLNLAYFAWRASGFSARAHPTRYLITFIPIAMLAEILARILVL